MHRLLLPAAFALTLVAGLSAQAQPRPSPPPPLPKMSPAAIHGRTLFLADGCYQCHGEQGQGGSNAGPKLAPTPLPLDAFTRQLRNPRDRMPVYSHVVLPDPDLGDVYAYLQSIPKAKAVDDIPLLKTLDPGKP